MKSSSASFSPEITSEIQCRKLNCVIYATVRYCKVM